MRRSKVAAAPQRKASSKSKYTLENPGPWGRAGRFLGGMAGGLAGGAAGLAGHTLVKSAGMAGPYGVALPAALELAGAPGRKFIVGAGAAAGKAIGQKIGSYAHYIGRIFGSGDYVTSISPVRQNSLTVGGQIPSFAGNKNEVRIRHREYLGDIITSSTAGAFQLQSYAINPGIAASFPWLSQVCGSTFQQYRLNGMVFEFRSMSADALNSTNTALGSVVMATDYDSKDALFTSKQQMENTEFGVSCKPSSCMIHAIECMRSQTPVSELYVRANAVPSGADPRLYDMGTFQIATVGMQGTSVNVGELWVSYDVSFLKAIEQPPGFQQPVYHLALAGSTAATPLLPLANGPAVFDTIGMTVTNTTAVFPLSIQNQSNWICILAYRGVSTAAVVSPTITGSNGLVQNANGGGWVDGGFQSGYSSGYSAPQTETGTTTISVYTFYYNGSGTPAALPTLTFGTGGTLPGAAVAGDLLIMRVNGTAV